MSDSDVKIIIPGVNTDAGLRICNGDIKTYIKCLTLFAEKMPKTLEKIRVVNENNLNDYSINIHSIKGMCDYLGAEEARKTAKLLEDMSIAADIKGILSINESFINNIETIKDSVQTWLKDNNSLITV